MAQVKPQEKIPLKSNIKNQNEPSTDLEDPSVNVLIQPENENPTDKDAFLTDEEITRLASTPFWKRTRIIVLSFFWILWAIMLTLTIYLIVNSGDQPIEDTIVQIGGQGRQAVNAGSSSRAGVESSTQPDSNHFTVPEMIFAFPENSYTAEVISSIPTGSSPAVIASDFEQADGSPKFITRAKDQKLYLSNQKLGSAKANQDNFVQVTKTANFQTDAFICNGSYNSLIKSNLGHVFLPKMDQNLDQNDLKFYNTYAYLVLSPTKSLTTAEVELPLNSNFLEKLSRFESAHTDSESDKIQCRIVDVQAECEIASDENAEVCGQVEINEEGRPVGERGLFLKSGGGASFTFVLWVVNYL